MTIVFLGLSITSAWGNGHATTYRALIGALAERGHDVVFLERNKPWYAANRDLPSPAFCRTSLYSSLDELYDEHATLVSEAEAVIVGSYVPDGIAVGDWVQRTAGGPTAFYDIDTPVTVEALEAGTCTYLAPRQVAGYHVYLSFTGGPTLETLQSRYGAPAARPLYCSVDPQVHRPSDAEPRWDLGYLGTYSDDRQPSLDRLLVRVARRIPNLRMVVGGAGYPESIEWPENVGRVEHVPPGEHRLFYGNQRATLNLTRAAMRRAGYSPSVRLFEASACAIPVISDTWPGLEDLMMPGREILPVRDTDDVIDILVNRSEDELREIGKRARERILAQHTAAHRAAELEQHLAAVRRRHAISGGWR